LLPNECLSTAKKGWEDVGRTDIRIEENHDYGDEINTPVICRGWMLQTSRPSSCNLSVRTVTLPSCTYTLRRTRINVQKISSTTETFLPVQREKINEGKRHRTNFVYTLHGAQRRNKLKRKQKPYIMYEM
jgi:hypothetical protein